MAGPWVYSERFIRGVGPNTLTYTVPVGKRAVVKCLLIANTDAQATNVGILIAGTQAWFGSVPGLSSANASGLMIVAYAGELVSVAIGRAGCTAFLSGYLLAT